MAFLASENVRMFPSAYRGTTDSSGNTLYDPESKLFSERNLTNMNKNVAGKDSFIDMKSSNITAAGNGKVVVCLGGYWFEITLTTETLNNIINNTTTSGSVYVGIKLTKQTNPTITQVSEQRLVNWDNSTDNLDISGNFTALYFSTSPIDADYSLKLLTYIGASTARQFSIAPESYVKFNPEEVTVARSDIGDAITLSNVFTTTEPTAYYRDMLYMNWGLGLGYLDVADQASIESLIVNNTLNVSGASNLSSVTASSVSTTSITCATSSNSNIGSQQKPFQNIYGSILHGALDGVADKVKFNTIPQNIFITCISFKYRESTTIDQWQYLSHLVYVSGQSTAESTLNHTLSINSDGSRKYIVARISVTAKGVVSIQNAYLYEEEAHQVSGTTNRYTIDYKRTKLSSSLFTFDQDDVAYINISR